MPPGSRERRVRPRAIESELLIIDHKLVHMDQLLITVPQTGVYHKKRMKIMTDRKKLIEEYGYS